MSRFRIILLCAGIIFSLFIGATSILPREIYGSVAWIVIWIIVGLILMYGICRRKMWNNVPLFLLHLSFIMIIAGGICTRFLSLHGTMILYPDIPERQFVSDEGRIYNLPKSITLSSFTIPTDSITGTAKDYVSEINTEDGTDYRISMNHIARIGAYRFYQTSYDEYGGSVLTVSRDPVGIFITYSGFLLFIIGGGWLLLRHKALGYRLTALCVIIGLAGYVWLTEQSRMSHIPILSTPWLYVHIFFVMMGYSFLASASAISCCSLICPSRLQKYQTLSMKLLMPGVYMLGLGIIIGATWANVSWGRYWGWDPKETWSLVTFLIYSIPLHKTFGLSGKPKASAVYLIFALLAIIMTYSGVNALNSLHAYN